jgi:hypothetical protein
MNEFDIDRISVMDAECTFYTSETTKTHAIDNKHVTLTQNTPKLAVCTWCYLFFLDVASEVPELLVTHGGTPPPLEGEPFKTWMAPRSKASLSA